MRGSFLLATALILASCAPAVELDDTTGSRLIQPAAVPNEPPRQPEMVDDVAIAGQEAAHAILALPAVDSATVPPLVQFAGVSSIVVGPPEVDTEPYTTLLRDRLLLLTRLKLRFVERTLPPLNSGKKGKGAAPSTAGDSVDYKLMAELRGKVASPLYWFQIQFVDAHSGEVLYDGLFRIRKEASEQPVYESSEPQAPPAPTEPPPPTQPQDPNYYQPPAPQQNQQPPPEGSNSIQ